MNLQTFLSTPHFCRQLYGHYLSYQNIFETTEAASDMEPGLNSPFFGEVIIDQ